MEAVAHTPSATLFDRRNTVERRELLRLKSLREQVYEHLHRAINSGDLEPGSFIDQRMLAAELGISRQPLRDALIQLELEGFVTVLPRRGVKVRKLELDDIRHLYQVIGALESYVLTHAAARVCEDEAHDMRELNASMVEAIETGDFDTYYDLNLAFHDVFLRTSDNPLLRRTVRICKQRLYDFPRERRFHREWELTSTAEHAHIVELIARSHHGEAADYLRDVHWSFEVQRPYIRAYYHMDDPEERAIASAP
ncbi:MAG: GntR family transcriptional regulator [Gemmatimonadetes bacterium]|nr:GntR family transcriptional regulator [Gemmatimonadota bacterium]